MGSAFSTAVAIVKTFLEIATLYSRTLSRFNLSPGVPCPYPTRSFWISDDDDKDKSLLSGETPPEYADVVIIGSGITGASIAHTLLTRLSESQSTIKKIVMVDARGICSGATGRNGGHIKTDNYGSYGSFKKSFGKETALNLDKFRNRALQELKAIDKECCGGKGQVRDVEALDCFFADDTFQKAKAKLQVWRDDAGETEGHYTHEIYEGAEARRKFQLSDRCVGVIARPNGAGAAHPYNLVTNLLRHLLSAYASYFQIFAYAAVTRILPPSSTTPFYTLETSRGTSIKTARIIHATNAYVNHLLPILRHKLFPLRVTMTAQRPGLSFPSKVYDGRRSWAFIYPEGFDYLTQLPDGDRELMLGGGHSYAPHEGMGEFGIVDDSKVHMRVEGYLSGALPIMFGLSNWGEEGRASTANGDDSKWEKGRVKAVWSGVITYSADTLTPWVGPLTQKMTSRSIPPGGGEWIAAGYSGEGMVHAWGCGKAVAMNVLDLEEREGEELPKEFWITGAKLKRAVVERMYEAIDDQH